MKLFSIILALAIVTMLFLVKQPNESVVNDGAKASNGHQEQLDQTDVKSDNKVSIKVDTQAKIPEVDPSAESNNSIKVETEPKMEKAIVSERTAFLNDTSLKYRTKLKHLHSLGQNLTAEEYAVMIDYLKNGPNNNAYDLHLKDEIMIKLESQATINPAYVDDLIDLAENQQIDGAFRGYVMQHIRSAYWTHEDERAKLQNAIYNGLSDHQSDVSGTALLAAAGLQQEFGGFDQETLRGAALDLINNEEAHLPSKISALQVAGELELHASLPQLRDALQTSKDTSFKLAAIHAIGKLGNEEDLDNMNHFLESEGDSIFKKATLSALNNLKARL